MSAMTSAREKLVLTVALSAVALMAAGSFWWRVNPPRGGSSNAPLGPGAAYDLSKHTRTRSGGEYRLLARIPTLPRAYSMAVDGNGRVAIGGDGKIVMGTPAAWQAHGQGDEGAAADGLVTLTVPTMFADQRSDGRVLSLAFSDDGRLYLGLRGGFAMFHPAINQELWPHKLVVDQPGSYFVSLVVTDDTLFAADAASRTVQCFNRRRGFTFREIDGRAGETEADSPGFILPSPHWAMAMGPDGLLRIANPGRRRVEAWTADGHREFVWGQGGPGVGQFSGCCNPAALAVLEDGRIVTAEKGDLLTVTVFEPDGPQSGTAGQVSCVVAGPDRFGLEDGAVSLAVTSDGLVLVLQTPGGMLSVFEPPQRGEGTQRGAGVSPASGEESQ